MDGWMAQLAIIHSTVCSYSPLNCTQLAIILPAFILTVIHFFSECSFYNATLQKNTLLYEERKRIEMQLTRHTRK